MSHIVEFTRTSTLGDQSSRQQRKREREHTETYVTPVLSECSLEHSESATRVRKHHARAVCVPDAQMFASERK